MGANLDRGDVLRKSRTHGNFTGKLGDEPVENFSSSRDHCPSLAECAGIASSTTSKSQLASEWEAERAALDTEAERLRLSRIALRERLSVLVERESDSAPPSFEVADGTVLVADVSGVGADWVALEDARSGALVVPIRVDRRDRDAACRHPAQRSPCGGPIRARRSDDVRLRHAGSRAPARVAVTCTSLRDGCSPARSTARAPTTSTSPCMSPELRAERAKSAAIAWCRSARWRGSGSIPARRSPDARIVRAGVSRVCRRLRYPTARGSSPRSTDATVPCAAPPRPARRGTRRRSPLRCASARATRPGGPAGAARSTSAITSSSETPRTSATCDGASRRTSEVGISGMPPLCGDTPPGGRATHPLWITRGLVLRSASPW